MVKTGPLPIFSPTNSRGPVAARPSLPECKKLVDCALWRARGALRMLHRLYRQALDEAPQTKAPEPPKTWADFVELRAARLVAYRAELEEREMFKREFPNAFAKALGAPPEAVSVTLDRGMHEGEFVVRVELREEGADLARADARVLAWGDGLRFVLDETDRSKRSQPVGPRYEPLIAVLLARAFASTERSSGRSLFPSLGREPSGCDA